MCPLQDRIVTMSDDQPQGGFWLCAIIGKKQLQLWHFPTGMDMSEPEGEFACSTLMHFAIDMQSPGFKCSCTC